jgi:hypothetical protein
MCGCNSTARNRDIARQARAVTSKLKVWAEPLDFYQSIDTSKWKPHEKAVVRSQINIYHRSGTLYHDTIQNLLSHYSTPV